MYQTLKLYLFSPISRLVQSRGVLGFGGVFIASIFAQTLSLTSTGFNAMVDSLWSGVVEVSDTFLMALDSYHHNHGSWFCQPDIYRVTIYPISIAFIEFMKQYSLFFLSAGSASRPADQWIVRARAV